MPQNDSQANERLQSYFEISYEQRLMNLNRELQALRRFADIAEALIQSCDIALSSQHGLIDEPFGSAFNEACKALEDLKKEQNK